MTSVLEPHTVLPPAESQFAGGDLARLAEALRTPGVGRRAQLTSPAGEVLALPDEIYDVLREVVDALAQGLAISVVPQHAVLTTQQAADMLNISRPTLVKLLEDGEIAYDKAGRHRRVRLVDLLEYKARVRARRRALLDEMTAEASEFGDADDKPDAVIQTR